MDQIIWASREIARAREVRDAKGRLIKSNYARIDDPDNLDMPIEEFLGGLSPAGLVEPGAKPEIPGELWMLRSRTGFVPSVDQAPRGETYLVAFSEAEARAAAAHQEDFYFLEGVEPVRVK